MKGIIILADGFEDVEALATIDILRRSKIVIDTISLDNKIITTQSKNKIVTDYSYSEININDYDFLIIPGGIAVYNVLDNNKIVDDIIETFYKKNKLICAICAAPMLLVKKGYLDNKKYTIFPSCFDKTQKGLYVDEGVIEEDQFITAKSMYYSIDFALTIVEKLQGKNQKERMLKQIQGK